MHLVHYEEARGDLAKALAAIEVSKRKSAKAAAWAWAEIALEHAQDLIGPLEADLGDGRYPDTEMLESQLSEVKSQSSE
jgi:hypothetical protein